MTLSMHPYGPFALFAAFTFCGTLWVFFAFPECKGRSMESTVELFSLRQYKIGFAQVPLPDTGIIISKDQDPDVDLERQVSSAYDKKFCDERMENAGIESRKQVLELLFANFIVFTNWMSLYVVAD